MRIGTVRPVAVAILVAGLGGCAASGGPTISVVADSFCVASKKITWVPDDSKETIDQIVKHNAGIDRACRVKGQKYAPTS